MEKELNLSCESSTQCDSTDSSNGGDVSSSSDSEIGAERRHLLGVGENVSRKRKSKQLQYYYRKTSNRMKRSYIPFKDQVNPSRQLRNYHKQLTDMSTESDHDENSLNSDHNSEIGSVGSVVSYIIPNAETAADILEDSSSAGTDTSIDDESTSSDISLSTECSEDDVANTFTDDGEECNFTLPETPLYKGSTLSRLFAFVLIVSFVLKHNLSKAAWADLLRLLSVLLGKQCEKVFQSVYKMKLYLKDSFGTKDPSRITYCSSCLSELPTGEFCTKDECRGKKPNVFLDLHLEEKIKELFRDAEFCKLLKRGKENVKSTFRQTIHDIYHGLDYKNFLHPGGFLTRDYNISFTINTDGVNKYSSSSAGHLWPVYVMINELPKEIRFNKKYIIPAYIYCDKKLPNMLTFLNPFVEKLNNLHANGVHIQDSAVGNITVKCMLFVVSADLPARAEVMNMKRYNGKCACHLCKQEGVGYGPNNIHRSWPLEHDIQLRSHEDQMDFASRATRQNAAVMGVKGHSAFAKISYRFDLIRSFAIDWMHCVALGVVKYVLNLMLADKWKGTQFYIGSKMESLSTRLVSIKPPDNIGRLPRSFRELKNWKATELKNWLLHYSVPVLRSSAKPVYFFHWCLLASAVGILCSDSISQDSIVQASEMLKDFVVLMGIIYGPTKCTMNVHLLQHLSYYVTRRGPLWSYSCFAFESLNAFLKSMVHGTHHAMEQIGCALGLSYGTPGFIEKTSAASTVSQEALSLLRKLNGQFRQPNKSLNIDGGYFLGKDIFDSLDISNNFKTEVRVFLSLNSGPTDYELQGFARFEDVHGHKYTSMAYRQTKKTNSTVVEFKDQQGNVRFGRIKFFLKAGDKGICVCNQLIEHNNDPYLVSSDTCANSLLNEMHLAPDDRETCMNIIRKYNGRNIVNHQVSVEPRVGSIYILYVTQLIRKCVFIDFSSECWIVSRFPNIVEHN